MVYREMESADRLVLASPLQFMSVSAQMKAMIDRCQALWARKYILKVPPLGDNRPRKGFFISVGGRRTVPNLFDAELVTIKILFKIIDVSLCRRYSDSRNRCQRGYSETSRSPGTSLTWPGRSLWRCCFKLVGSKEKPIRSILSVVSNYTERIRGGWVISV